VTSPDARPTEWTQLSDEQLLDVRLCDLRLSLRTSPLKERIRPAAAAELRAHGLRFEPHFWISDEWFTPDGVPGIAVPFYLAHTRLCRLELNQMLEVEGGTEEWCMNILRHEADTPSTTRSPAAPALNASGSSDARRRAIPRSTGRGRTASDSSSTWTTGMRRPIPTRTSRRPSHLAGPSAGGVAAALRRLVGAAQKLEYVDRLMREIAGREPRSPRIAGSTRSRRTPRRCASTTRRGATTTASRSRPRPTTTTSAGSSPTGPSTTIIVSAVRF
jgi:hypothetical protein